MEGRFSTGQNPQWAVVPMEEEEGKEEERFFYCIIFIDVNKIRRVQPPRRNVSQFTSSR